MEGAEGNHACSSPRCPAPVLRPNQDDVLGGCGDPQLRIEGCQRKTAAASQFQVRRVIESKAVSRGQFHRRTPGVTISLRIDADRQESKVGQRGIPESRVRPPFSHAHFEKVANFQPPESRDPSSGLDDSGQHIGDRSSGFSSVNPGESYGTVENQTQARPSSRSALRTSQLKDPVFRLLARERIRSAAPFACTRSIPPALATNRATGLPCRVITISSPRSTRSSSVPSVFLASKAPTSCMASS